MSVSRALKSQQTETEIAILQVQVANIEQRVDEIKEDLKDLRDGLDKHADNQVFLIKEMQDSSAKAHKSMSDKISALEKWRWMMMGAGVVIGSLGFDTLARLLK